MRSRAPTPLSTRLSHALVAFTIELDNEFERRFAEAGGRARVASVVMWSSFLRFVGDGITVGELPDAARLQKPRVLSTLGGMERWRYVAVGPDDVEKRAGWGSARGLQSDWVVRPTADGREAAAIWPTLFDEIETRWNERFGTGALEDLKSALRAIVERIEVELPEFLPIVGGANGMVAHLPPLEKRSGAAADNAALNVSGLLSRTLLAYTLDFERSSALSLPLSANVVRVLDAEGVLVRDIPRRSGISAEATSMALTFLAKTPYVVVEGTTAATKLARLTPAGAELLRGYTALHREVEAGWLGAGVSERLRSSLEHLLEQRAHLSRGLEPPAGAWRGHKEYVAHTEAVIADPTARLPHYPMVLHRGGWPDGS